jgi:hypothetical protein
MFIIYSRGVRLLSLIRIKFDLDLWSSKMSAYPLPCDRFPSALTSGTG